MFGGGGITPDVLLDPRREIDFPQEADDSVLHQFRTYVYETDAGFTYRTYSHFLRSVKTGFEQQAGLTAEELSDRIWPYVMADPTVEKAVELIPRAKRLVLGARISEE